jgi:hypothetical protein
MSSSSQSSTSVANPSALGLVGAERQQLPALHHAGDLDVLVHHGSGDGRVEPARLRERAELGAHHAHDLLARLLALARYRGRGAERGAGPHVDVRSSASAIIAPAESARRLMKA